LIHTGQHVYNILGADIGREQAVPSGVTYEPLQHPRPWIFPGLTLKGRQHSYQDADIAVEDLDQPARISPDLLNMTTHDDIIALPIAGTPVLQRFRGS